MKLSPRRSCVEALESRRLLAAYHMTFKDEFTNFDVSKWSTADFWGMRNNGGDFQAQWFSAPAQNGHNPFINSNGVLSIRAQPTPAGVNAQGLPYVSGQLTTAHKFTQRYGYYELRAKTPAGKGLWSRFWLLGDDGNWPSSTEYDAFEILGKETNKIRQTTHYADANGNHAAQGNPVVTTIDPTDGFHRYGLLWEPGGVTWYVDGVATGTQINRSTNPMYVLIDLAVGNDPNNWWPGTPDATTKFPADFQVDYFRVYSADSSLPSVAPEAGITYPTTLPGNNTVMQTPTTPQLPSGWTAGDLGTPNVKGSATWNASTGEWMLKGAGYGISGFGDQGHFASRSLTGDGSITATVSTVSAIHSNDVKTGVAIRETGAANSKSIGLYHVTSYNDTGITRSLVLQTRSASGGNTTTLATVTGVPGSATLRLSRSGNVFTASYSTNGGSTWTNVGTPQTLAMTPTVQAGLAISGNQNNYLRLSRSTFTNVTVTSGTSTPPTVVSPASASPLVVVGKSANLSVLGADNTGEAGLKYIWSSTGPAPVTYGSNSTNGSKNTTATFSRAGSYAFTVTVQDAEGATTTSTVNVTVNQTLSAISVTPKNVTLGANATQQFTAAGLDQFGQTMAANVTWSRVGGGTISSTGLYTSPTSPGSATVTATAGALSSSGVVTITQATGLPNPWVANSISNSAAGSSVVSNGTWTLTGAGTGVALNSSVPDNVDSFRFVHRMMTGDGTIIVRVDSSTGGQAGIVIRDGTGAGDRYAGLWRTADSLRWGTRETISGGAWLQAIRTSVAVLPVWLRLVRTGNTFTASFSTDGATWSTIGSRTFAMNATARVGFVVASGSNTSTSTASFSHLTTIIRPTVLHAARATPSPVTGKTTALSVLGNDDAGEANLTYTWSLTGTPPAAVGFGVNGTNAAKNTIATFSKAGTYGFLVTIRDSAGLTTTSSVNVTVNQTLAGITITPASPTVNVGGTRQFTAVANDQFGVRLSVQPAFTWAKVNGIGSISGTGLYTAPATVGSANITATAGSVTGSAGIVVGDIVAPTLSSVVSTKVHGANGSFNLNLALGGTTKTIEPRLNGASKLIFSFSEPIKALDGVLGANEFSITNATFGGASISGNRLTLNLTNVINKKYAKITLAGIGDLSNNVLTGVATLTVGNLYGDADQSGTVTSLDLQIVTGAHNQTVTSANFLFDVNSSGGVISAIDEQVVKDRLQNVLS